MWHREVTGEQLGAIEQALGKGDFEAVGVVGGEADARDASSVAEMSAAGGIGAEVFQGSETVR